jgi:hypothetical protein
MKTIALDRRALVLAGNNLAARSQASLLVSEQVDRPVAECRAGWQVFGLADSWAMKVAGGSQVPGRDRVAGEKGSWYSQLARYKTDHWVVDSSQVPFLFFGAKNLHKSSYAV